MPVELGHRAAEIARPGGAGFALAGDRDALDPEFLEALEAALAAAGFAATDDPAGAALVVNLIDPAAPRPFRRKSRGTFVAGIAGLTADPADPLRETYPLLVRSLSNVVLCHVQGRGVWFTTMERGSYLVRSIEPDGLAAAVVERLAPLARSRLVIENLYHPDLEPELWQGDPCTVEIASCGRRLDALGLLPAPFPIEEILGERDLRHVKRLYGIGGLSYGNLSMRKDERRFWMSASGVDKSRLVEPGRDILLVSDYDEAHGRIVLSVPPGIEPRRVSVDAIEHWMIYRENPGVGAILHVHAWVDGASATDVNYPCGTEELALAVAGLVRAAPDPAHAVVGLRNHGITATGATPNEILTHLEPRLLRRVPMS
jgi:ribulose-5-phosphate 4-epimerase/fuculose-1-phosphate aldolase